MHQQAVRAGGGEVGEAEDGVRQSRAQGSALASLACGVAAVGWLRPLEGDEGLLAIPSLCAGMALVGVSAVGVRLVRAVRGRQNRDDGRLLRLVASAALSVFVAFGAVLAALIVVLPWAGWFGSYALPPGNMLGVLLGVAAVCLGIGSIARRERALATAVSGLALGMLVLAVSYIWDPIADTPYGAVRRFAAAAARADQEAMISQFSAESVRHLDELPRTTYFVAGESDELITVRQMHPPAARETLLLSVQREDDRATVECVVPITRSATGFFGHGGRIYVIREDGAWKIDAYRHWQETRERMADASTDTEDAADVPSAVKEGRE